MRDDAWTDRKQRANAANLQLKEQELRGLRGEGENKGVADMCPASWGTEFTGSLVGYSYASYRYILAGTQCLAAAGRTSTHAGWTPIGHAWATLRSPRESRASSVLDGLLGPTIYIIR